MMTFHLYSSLLLISFSYISVKNVALESHPETVEITTDQCKRPFTDPKEWPKSTLEVFNMYGPCSPRAGKNPKNMPSAQELLHHDRLRVESLQARFKHNSKTNKYDTRFKDTKEVHIPALYNNGLYAIRVSLGTPQQIKTLAFDTGSDMTWVQGYIHNESATFESISCTDTSFCTTSYIPYHTCNKFDDKENMCYFRTKYMDNAYFEGVFSKDILNITQTGEVFPKFLFSCSIETNNLIADGMLGLGESRVSFVNQTSDTYNKIFSYCIPSRPRTTGFLKLGPGDYPNDVKFTPFITSSDRPSLYFINITSIKVGGVELSIGKFDLIFPGTVIDSGTTLTYLPKNVYRMMRDEFRKNMSSYGHLSIHSRDNRFDTCYYNSRNLTANKVPTITFIFQRGVTVDMDAYATLFGFSRETKIVCLAFVGNTNNNEFSILGNYPLRRFEVVYDVYGEKLMFIPNRCH